MLRGDVPRLFNARDSMVLGKVRELGTGNDLLLLSSGICTEEALRATSALRQKRISVAHLHVSTLKPFATESLLAAAEGVRHGVITIENHTIVGGLGSLVAETLAEAGMAKKLIRLGLQDVYAHGASLPYLKKKYGLDAGAVIGAAELLLNQQLNIHPSELAIAELGPRSADAQAEDL
jgi:transketolase